MPPTMSRHLSDTLVLLMVVGTAEDLAAGRGETVITVTEAAAVLGVSRQAVSKMVASDRLVPLTRYEGAWLFKESDVRKLRDERQLRS